LAAGSVVRLESLTYLLRSALIGTPA
jgi:hypothetical protein